MAGADPDRMRALVWGAKTTIPKGAIGPAQADREAAAMSYFIGRGYSREQAAGIVGNLVHESAGLAPSSRNPGDGSDGSDSVGIAQWNGARAKCLKAFAADRGKDWRDLAVQLAFVDHELNTDYAGVKARLRAANTADEAAGVFVTDYERPAGSQGGAAASHGWDNRRNQARRLAAGDYKPGEVEEKAPDPVVASLAPDQRDGLVAYAQAQHSQGQAVAQGDLEPRIQDATRALTTIGRYDGRLPSEAEFSASYGPQDGARRYNDFQRTVNLGADITAIRAMTPAEQTAWLAARVPKGEGPAFETQRQLHERGTEAIALDQAFRRKDPNGYVRSLHPQIDRLWTEAGTSPERLRAALATTNAAMDRLGMPTEGRALLPKAMVDQALAAFGDRSKPMAERLAPLRASLTASADPGAQQAIFGQMVAVGLPPALEYAAIAYAKGDAPLAERFATAALGSPDAGGKATGGADDASLASPAAAANTPAGPAPMHSLSGPAIDLGPAAAQALGSSLTGDERTSRAETVRARMIENAMRSNGGDRPAAIAQTDRDLASLQGDGWVPGMYMRPSAAGAGTQLAFQNTENNPAFPGATQSDGASRMPAPLPGGKSKIGKGLGAGLPGIIGGEISNSIWPQPEDGSENYPNTSIPKSYYISVDPFGKVFVPPAITQFFVDELKGVSPAAADLREHSLPSHTGEANSAIKDARVQLMRAERRGDPQPYYTGTSANGISFDIAFAPTKEADGTVTVTAIRLRGLLTNWIQRAVGNRDPIPGAWWGTPPKPLWEGDAPPSAPTPIGTPGISNGSPAREPVIHRPVWTKDNPYDEVTYDAELKRTGNSALALEVAKAAYRTRTDNPSSNGSFSASGGGRSSPPPAVTPETDWVRALYEKLPGVKRDWTEKAFKYQKENKITLPQPDVFALSQMDELSTYSVNQSARIVRGSKDQETFATESVQKRDKVAAPNQTRANETMFDAHAELHNLEDFHVRGNTEGKSLRTVVFGKELCRSCRTHLPYAAEKAKLKEWIIYEQATGKTLYWKSGDVSFTVLNGD